MMRCVSRGAFSSSPLHILLLLRGTRHNDSCFWLQTMVLMGLPGYHTWVIIPAARDLDHLAGSHPASLPSLTLLNGPTSPDSAPKISEGFKAPTLDSVKTLFFLGMYRGGKGWGMGPNLFLNTGHSVIGEMSLYHHHPCCR